MRLPIVALTSLLVATTGCGSQRANVDDATADTGTSDTTDAGATTDDADAGSPNNSTDAGSNTPDAPTDALDGGSSGDDAGSVTTPDAGEARPTQAGRGC